MDDTRVFPEIECRGGLDASLVRVDPSAFIAETATLIGAIDIAPLSSIWYGVVIRADRDRVAIGPETSIQENSVIHTEPGLPTIIGKGVTVGHLALVHGARVGDDCLIGMGSMILNGAVVGENCIVGAGALVTENAVIPPNSLVLGVPGKVVRQLTPEEAQRIRESAEAYVNLSRMYLRRRQR